MQTVALRLMEQWSPGWDVPGRSHLDIPPASQVLRKVVENSLGVFWIVHQKLAVIREGQGHQAPSRHPRLNLAEHRCVTKLFMRGGGGEGDRQVSIEALQRL